MIDNEDGCDTGHSSGFGTICVVFTVLIIAILCFVVGFFSRPYLMPVATPTTEHFSNISEKEKQRYLSMY
jgi:hypothetical protein